MAIVNFSVPDEAKKEFDRAFNGKNESAVIADLMRQAVAEVNRRKQCQKLFKYLTERRTQGPDIKPAHGQIRPYLRLAQDLQRANHRCVHAAADRQTR